MNYTENINIWLESFGVLITLIMIICISISVNRHTKLNSLFMKILISQMVILICDTAAWIFNDIATGYAVFITHAANFVLFCFSYILLGCITDYLVEYTAKKAAVSVKSAQAVRLMIVASIILVIFSQFNHMYYYIDEHNHYTRQSMFWLSQICGAVGVAVNTVLIVSYRKFFSVREFCFLMSYLIIPLFGMTVQTFVNGPAFLNLSIVLASLVLYSGIEVEQSAKLKENELEIIENRVAIMMSQIQPHFLYNVLVVIKQLCDIDPVAAKEAVMEFSSYLRVNLESITKKIPIPFEKEMEHVKNYLSLEKKRFGKKININYDLQANSFFLPALTIQPIVENAVKYGITKKEEGGTILIKSTEDTDSFIIVVKDDGTGFSPDDIQNDGQTHIGLFNVQNRLENMCGGSLHIESINEKGTEITIKIPKGTALNDHYHN